jgi:carotenoid cleavage dioxygenase
VIEHAGRLLSLVETALPFAVTDELETIGPFDFDGHLDTPMTAHPKRCALTGELHFFGYQAERPYLTYYIADARGEIVSRREIPVDGPSLLHDFAITERYALFFDSPARMVGSWDGMPFQWSEAAPARIAVVPRAGGALRWLEVERGHLGHTANAFESGGRIVLDAIRYARFPGAPPFLHRWELDLESGRAREQPFDARPVEFPRIDDRRMGRAHRYTYVVELRDIVDDVPTCAPLRRYDVVSGTSQVHDFGPQKVAGECVLVPAHDGAAEDEGWLITLVYDGERKSSDLVVLDARAFDAPPLARVRLPGRVPFGFHGNWVPFTNR